MRLLTRRWIVTSLALALLCAAAIALTLTFQPLTVTPMNCGRLMTGGRCEVEPGPLRLFIEPPADIVIIIGSGHLPAISTHGGARGLLVALDVGGGRRSLWVLGLGGRRWGVGRVPLAALARPRWLSEALRAWVVGDAATLTRVTAELEQRLRGPLDPCDRVEALRILGSIANAQDRTADAKRLLREAIAASRAAGLVSEHANSVFVLATVLGNREMNPGAALLLMDEEREVLEQARPLRPWVLQNRGMYRAAQADLRGALALQEEGLAWAQRTGDEVARYAIAIERSRSLAALGRFREADAGLALPPRPLACIVNYMLEAQAQLRLSRWESVWPSRAPADLDPRQKLQEALAARKQGCADRHITGELYAGLARAELLAGDVAAAARWLPQVEAAAIDPALRVAALERRAEVALAQDHRAEARAGFTRLLEVAADPATSRAVQGSPGWLRWRAHLGLGQVHEAEARASGDAAAALAAYEAALAEYRAAEALLDRLSLEVPLELGRNGFLGRHEASARLLLDLLDRLDRPAQALAALRHARTRGLRTLLRLARLAGMDPEQRARWRVSLDGLARSRAELDERLKDRLDLLAGERRAEEQRVRAELEARLLRQMEVAQAALGEPPAPPAQSPPGPGEVLLGCHEVRDGWLCLAADAQEARGVRLPRLGPSAAEAGSSSAAAAELAERLLPRIADLLRRGRVLKVLGHGAFRAVDVHLLPFEGKPLQDHLDVRYAMDVPVAPSGSAPAAAGAERRALLYVGTVRMQQGLGERARGAVRGALQRQGWQVAEPPTDPEGKMDAAAAQQLRALLGQADLLHYFGHGERAPLHSQGRLIGADNPLLVSDLLLLPRAPRHVVLLACDAGLAIEETGGLEGLSVAYAFLLRGSAFVIASPRALPTEDAAALSQEIYQPDLLGSPTAALRRLARAAGASPAARAARALRVYVP